MRMDCTGFESRLEGLVEGTLSSVELDAAREHLRCCPACRELARLADGSLPTPGGLVEAVLSRTSGTACARVREILVDATDAPLEGLDAELLRVHVDNCVECDGLARALAQLAVELPLLAEIRPDRSFVADVIARTTGRRRRHVGVVEGLVDGWQRLLRRPRFAFEGAYVLTLVVLLVFGVPGSLVAAASRRAVELAPVDLPSRVERSVTAMGNDVSGRAQDAWTVTRGNVSRDARDATLDLAAYGSAILETTKTRVGTFWRHLASAMTDDDDSRRGDRAHRHDGDEP